MTVATKPPATDRKGAGIVTRPMMEAIGVHKSYGTNHVLRGVI